MNARPDPATLVKFPTQPPIHDAVELTKGGVQALIALNGQVYNLRITRAGKLILTK